MAGALGQLTRLTRRGVLGGFAGLASPATAFAETLPSFQALSSSQAPAAVAEAPIINAAARILPVLADHGMVVSQEKQASAIGVDVLRRGGNAVDAGVATALALAVTLPRAGNLGGGGFMLIHLAASNKTVAIDYRETAPAAATSDMFLDADGRFVPARSQASGLGVGTPGTVAGLALALERYGSGRFTLAALAAPAIALARDGILVDEDLADSLPVAARRLGRYPSSRAIFLRADGSAPARGARLVQSDLATTLETLAREGPRGFYEGAVARKIVAAVTAAGGRMTLDDLAGYRAIEREPVRGMYRGAEIVSMPPPSSGGVHVVQILNMIEAFPLASFGHNSARMIQCLAEAMKLAYADRSRYMGDPDFVAAPVARLVSKDYAARLAATIALEHARPSSAIAPGALLPHESDQTTHFSVVDSAGDAVSNTYTLNFSYGLGLVAEGTGVLLNNELDDFAARDFAPNAYGLIGGAANAPAPRKRPLSSMSPTLVFRDGALALVTGSPGGSRIINIVTQMLINSIDFGMNVAQASVAPRVHHQWSPDELQYEEGLSVDTLDLLRSYGQNLRPVSAFGSAQSIARVEGALAGASDTRQRGGAATGF